MSCVKHWNGKLSATLKIRGGREVLIVYEADDVQPVEPKRSIQSG